MPKKISLDKKLSVIDTYNCKNTYKLSTIQISIMFSISRQSIYNWSKLKQLNKLTSKINNSKKSSIITNEIETTIIKRIINNPNFNMRKLVRKIKSMYQININKHQIYRILKRNKITHKKAQIKIIKNKRKHKQDVKKVQKNVLANKDKIIFIDETHIDINVYPEYGWNYSNKRVLYQKNKIPKQKRFTLIGFISNKKTLGYQLINENVNGETFAKFIKEEINSKFKNKICFLDNARIHHSKLVKATLDKSNTLMFNVPYTPELNPIEYCFSKFKKLLQNNYEITNTNIKKSIKNAWNKITDKDVTNAFNHSYKN